jgi:hypothetical protein
LNERINQLEIAISRNQNTYNNAEFRNNNLRLCFHCNSPDHMIKKTAQGDRVNLTELTHNYRETSRRQFRKSEVDGNGDNRAYK